MFGWDEHKLDQTSMKTFKKISKEKQLGFQSNLIKKIHVRDLGYNVDQIGFKWDEQGLLD